MFKNKINGKIYVGKTKRKLEIRVKEHIKGVKGSYIDSAIKKHGIENFEVSILEECNSMEELNKREIFWIRELNCKYPNGYNMTDGGLGHVVNLETRQNLLRLIGTIAALIC